VLIANCASVISAGTEKLMMDLASKSLLGKARERPDQVRRVIEKIRNEGLLQTVGQVRAKLDEPVPMGYCSAGIVLACGPDVQTFKPGERVSSNGPHAGVVCVPKHLCARIPDNVPFDTAAFAVLGAIALQGVRLSKLTIGETALVIGLGLIGQITVALLKAAGVRVLGTDLQKDKCTLAMEKMGADAARPGLTAADVTDFTGGLGTDAVLITASTKSQGPIDLASNAVRPKGRIVLVGVVNLELDRRPFYFKEAEFVVSCSYGPGRYDPLYEEHGRDYPPAHVRWTEQRNIQAVLDLMGSGRLDVAPLITHRFPIEQAEAAYELIQTNREPYLGVVLTYPEVDEHPRERTVGLRLSTGAPDGKIPFGFIGAGNFARLILAPIIARESRLYAKVICSAGGLNAVHLGKKLGFDTAVADEDAIFEDPAIKAVFIATRHDQHARQVVKAIKSGQHVFVEKPIALTLEEFTEIEQAIAEADSPPLVMVGFNRRFSPAAIGLRNFLEHVHVPKTVSIRFNAGVVPPEHWTQVDTTGGGRIIGEACHAIDLATYLVGAPPVRVFAESVGGGAGLAVTDDQCFITLRHADGSISSIAYLAGGDKAFPKERVEVFGGGCVGVIDDFRELLLCRGGKTTRKRYRRQDKGHGGEVAAFVEALVDNGRPPISWQDIRGVFLATVLAVRSIREGIPFDIPGFH
jgi:predicted dehydrogenase/threonine dehydrogenase-like Zn-dependent dehydrogenase